MPSFGGTVKLQGESDYRKALREIQSSLKLVSSELKLTNSEFQNGDKSLKETKSSYSNMNTTIQEQKTKISDLKKIVAEMSEKYGENSEKVKTFKTQLNNAETQLNQMENATDKSNKELKEMKNNFDDAGGSGIKFGEILKANVISEAIIGGVKALGSAVKTLGSAALDLGKHALESYADYEQLVGGVDTLFKDNSETVQEYANNAYKTAGISANEYMETVTSFSASLLQSLGQDTEAASKYADQAIIDMSDNANKMGTDMTSIQNAYQGFAKQNYTMLDNLKLGYGGTKGEMQRLIADANKVKEANGEMANLSIDSFADVTEAIHIIQTEMGITGTTALEANTTIEGSVNSMKSAWQNMLVGIADDNADFDKLVNNLVDSIVTAAGNILPRIETIIDGIIKLVLSMSDVLIEHLPEIVDTGTQMLQGLIDGIVEMIPEMLPVIVEVINSFTQFVVDNLPTIIDAGVQVLLSLVEGIAQSLPELIPSAVDAIITIAENLIDNVDMIVDAGIDLIMGLADGLIEALPILIEKAPEIIKKLYDAFVRNFPKIVQAGGELLGKLVAGLSGSLYKLLEVAPQIIGNVVKGIKDGWGEIVNVGKYLVEGLWNGISGMASWVAEKVKSFAKNIVGNIKEALGIHSPSAILRDEVGKYMAEGIGVGFSDEMKDVASDMQQAIPTEFDVSSTLRAQDNSNNNMSMLRTALVDAFKEFKPKIILDGKEVGEFAFEYGNIKYGKYFN